MNLGAVKCNSCTIIILPWRMSRCYVPVNNRISSPNICPAFIRIPVHAARVSFCVPGVLSICAQGIVGRVEAVAGAGQFGLVRRKRCRYMVRWPWWGKRGRPKVCWPWIGCDNQTPTPADKNARQSTLHLESYHWITLVHFFIFPLAYNLRNPACHWHNNGLRLYGVAKSRDLSVSNHDEPRSGEMQLVHHHFFAMTYEPLLCAGEQ